MINFWFSAFQTTIPKGEPSSCSTVPELEEKRKRMTVTQKARKSSCRMVM